LLRKIQLAIEDYEPQFEPFIVPLPEDVSDRQGIQLLASSKPKPSKFPGAGYYSVADYRALYLSGEVTPTDVARALIPLIRRDTTPPGQHSIAFFDTKIELVLRAAQESTERYKQKRSLGPLDGVPTAVKDEYDVVGYKTCLGSANDYTGGIADQHGDYTNWLVLKMQEAGAILIGKLSMPEFGLDTPGNCPVYGTPPNPYNPRYYTGGSSSGTGYAVSAGLVPIALGSDGGGSIRIPASFCSTFGLKPTHGRMSFKPGQNHCLTCAVLGPIAADVRSLATVYEVIGQPHPTSPFPSPLPAIRMLPHGQSPRVLGIPTAWNARATPTIRTLLDTMVDRLVRERGYSVVPIEIPYLVEGQIAHAVTVLTDGATLLPSTRNLTPANKMLLALGRTTPAADYMLGLKLRRLLMQHLAWLWEQHPGMVILTPTTSCEGFPIKTESELKWGISDGDRTIQTMEYCWLANFCGLPSMSVPAGFVAPEGHARYGVGPAGPEIEGRIPVGIMASGEWASEEGLFQFALDAEEVGAEMRAKPAIWTDVFEAARLEKKANTRA
jgi:Asp-tRNA(Asn)/Glu-tRNA(Gln) amidotransferase A subunit family amidase